MRSRTSFFNGPIFRKNLSRFAPLWCGYALCLLLGMLLMMNDNLEYWFAVHLGTMASVMAIVNLGYALVVAQALFGDLWNSRMCSGLHALPLSRECWFHTHVASGFFFSLVPTAVMACAAIPFLASCIVENSWQIPLYFLLAANLEYLFFFGLAVFSALCAGNRVGMTVIYGIANLGSYLVYFLVDTLITPMYYGVITPGTVFKLLCPVVQITTSPLVECQRQDIPAGVSTTGEPLYDTYATFWLGDGWLYLGAAALLGLVLLALAKGMYRRRRLECAGDALATEKLAPVFMVMFSVTIGVAFQFTPSVFGVANFDFPLFLYIGVAVGWFAGRMLLERQTHVFRRGRTWLGLCLTLAVLAGGLYGLSLDPFGIEDWVPAKEDVKTVTISNGYRGTAEVTEPEQIDTVLQIHRGILVDKLTHTEIDEMWKQAYDAAMETQEVQSGLMGASEMAEKMGCRQYTTARIQYTLKNGLVISREYQMWVDTEAAELAKPFFSSISAIFYHQQAIQSEEDLAKIAQVPKYMYIDSVAVPQEALTLQMAADLKQAIIADSKAGTLIQTGAYHPGFVEESPTRFQKSYSIDISFGSSPEYLYFSVYADSQNCLQWMETYGLRELAETSAK